MGVWRAISTDPQRQKWVFIGGGAIGLLFAGWVSKVVPNTHVLTNREKLVLALQSDGLLVKHFYETKEEDLDTSQLFPDPEDRQLDEELTRLEDELVEESPEKLILDRDEKKTNEEVTKVLLDAGATPEQVEQLFREVDERIQDHKVWPKANRFASKIVEDGQPADVVVICTKGAHDTEKAADQAVDLTANNPDAVVISLQNGIGYGRIISDQLDKWSASSNAASSARLSLSTTTFGADVDINMVRVMGIGEVTLSDIPASEDLPDKKSKEMQIVEEVLQLAGFATELTPYAKTTENLWRKLVVNCCINPVATSLGVANGALLDNEAAFQVMSSIAREAVEVSRAAGHSLGIGFKRKEPADVAKALKGRKLLLGGTDSDNSDDDTLAINQLTRVEQVDIEEEVKAAMTRVMEVIGLTVHNLNSMIWDLSRKRLTEVPFINGAVVMMGHQVNVPTPVNLMMVQTIHKLENSLGIKGAPDVVDMEQKRALAVAAAMGIPVADAEKLTGARPEVVRSLDDIVDMGAAPQRGVPGEDGDADAAAQDLQAALDRMNDDLDGMNTDELTKSFGSLGSMNPQAMAGGQDTDTQSE